MWASHLPLVTGNATLFTPEMHAGLKIIEGREEKHSDYWRVADRHTC